VTLSVKDTLDTVTQLDYRYDDDPKVTGQSKRRAAPPQVTRQFLPAAQPEQLPVTAQTGINLTSDTTQTQITLAPDTASRINQLMQGKRAIVLSLQIDHVKDTDGVIYEIYANLPANEKPARNSIYFVGSMGFFTAWDGSVTKTFDLTQPIRTLQDKKAWNANQLTITFVPRGPINAKTKQPLPLQPSVRAVVGGVSLAGQ